MISGLLRRCFWLILGTRSGCWVSNSSQCVPHVFCEQSQMWHRHEEPEHPHKTAGWGAGGSPNGAGRSISTHKLGLVVMCHEALKIVAFYLWRGIRMWGKLYKESKPGPAPAYTGGAGADRVSCSSSTCGNGLSKEAQNLLLLLLSRDAFFISYPYTWLLALLSHKISLSVQETMADT